MASLSKKYRQWKIKKKGEEKAWSPPSMARRNEVHEGDLWHGSTVSIPKVFLLRRDHVGLFGWHLKALKDFISALFYSSVFTFLGCGILRYRQEINR